MSRHFQDKVAVREKVPLLIGLMGASGSGKTFSALRIAEGIKKVHGGPIVLIDTEGGRALSYAEDFDFNHVRFAPPFPSLDCLDAIKHCAELNPSVIIFDSMSHEHEGEGGVLEQHAKEVERRSKGDYKIAEKIQFSCWAKPKSQRNRLINGIIQTPCNMIFCFRAKPKSKPGKSGMTDMGWMPIAGDEFLFQMSICALLKPGSMGVPDWHPTLPGEQMMTKMSKPFIQHFSNPHALCEEDGEFMARWAMGAKPPSVDDKTFRSAEALIVASNDENELALAMKTLKDKPWGKDQSASLRVLCKQIKEQLKVAPNREPGEEG